MTGGAGLHLRIAGVFDVSTHEADGRSLHAVGFHEPVFGAPEAAGGKVGFAGALVVTHIFLFNYGPKLSRISVLLPEKYFYMNK
ncbi:MAG: hypothetical protein LBK58_14970, partial [Prevotellaceae bacterium]|nr:hypothetical protein [Prevotellaceae bacterium]